MPKTDLHYHTISEMAEGIYREKGSKFLACAAHVATEDAAKAHIHTLRKGHPKARHVCYAWRIGPEGTAWRANDDGEPSGTGGKPILGRLIAAELTYVCVGVVRYFGGTKLGAAGLARAYRDAAADALTQADIVRRERRLLFRLELGYPALPALESLLGRMDIEVQDRVYAEDRATFNLRVPMGRRAAIEKSFRDWARPTGAESTDATPESFWTMLGEDLPC